MKMRFFNVSKAVLSIILSLTIIFSGISVIAVTVDDSASVGSNYATFDTSKTYYIWLKDDTDNTDAPLKEIRRSIFRWNMNGNGTGHNAVVHLDYQYGENCAMELQDVGDGYYGIRYKNDDNPYWIDTEGDNQNTNEVLHQNSKKLEYDDKKQEYTKYNQHFQFIPVPGEKDTYYIYCRKAKLYVGVRDNKIERESKLVTADESNRKKWIVTSEDYLLSGKEEQLYGSKNGAYKPTSEAPMFTLNPLNYDCDVNVNDDGDVIGNCLQLFYIGTSSKITAEWVESKNAYRLRNYSTLEKSLDNDMNEDFVWDVNGQSVDEPTSDNDAVLHLWKEQGTTHASQFWRFIPVEGKQNVYYIYNVNSCLYASIEGGYDNNNDKNEVKLVQSKTAFPWELHILNKNGFTEYTADTTDEEINHGNWMSRLPDSMYLSEVNIPGTHDAGATNLITNNNNQLSLAICQQLYLNEQLNAGIRAWDMRIDSASAKYEDDPNIIHGFSAFLCQNQKEAILELEEVMQTARDFLELHPQETIVMTLKADGKSVGDDEDVANHILKYIKNEDYPIYRPAKGSGGIIPTLGNVRGKIVFIRRLKLSNEYIDNLNEQSESLSYSLYDAFGPDASKWDDNNYSDYTHAQQVGSSNIYVQDNYGEGDADKKLEYFTGTIDDATDKKLTANGNAYLFNYSAATDSLYQPRKINAKLMKEERLNQPTSLSDSKTIGMVMTNYIDAKLSRKIYMTNFITEHTHTYSDNGFCTICDQYQPATLNGGVYEISNAGQLFWFASLVNGDDTHADFDVQNTGAKGILVKDINLENREWSPIMNFSGTFDGNNHTISNLNITKTSTYSGLFGKTSGTLKNFTLKGNITLSADGDMIGGAVGNADGSTISNVTSYVNISNTEGALKHIGGVVGGIDNKNTVVDKCAYYGTLNISNSHDCIGGIVGYSNAGARISNCANHGTVTTSEAGAYTGGILGYVNNSNPTIKDCYNFGTVSNGDSTQYCGAIIGWARNYTSANIDNNYYLDSSSSLAFGSGSKSGVTATAKTAEQFKSGEVAYLLNHSVTDGTQVWYQNLDNGETPDDYPVFEGGTVYYLEYKNSYSNTYSEKPEPNEFDKDNGNFIIRTYDDLAKLSNLVRSDYEHYGSANYILENNIKAPDDSKWTHGIGSVSENKPFNGTFDGNGYCIIGLNVDSPKYGGLFEVIGENGKVKDLFVFDCDFTSASETAGGIAALNYGTIDHCSSGVNITSGGIHPQNIEIYGPDLNSIVNGETSGGITGENNGTIIGCRNSSIVKGSNCGGVAGVNNGTIYGCANNGKVGTSTTSVTGGLAGKNCDTIESSYNSGNVYGYVIGSIAGKNGYNGATSTVNDVFYISQSEVNAFGTTPWDTSFDTITEKTSDAKYDEKFTMELNSVTDKSKVKWKFNPPLNKGYPIIEGNFYIDVVKSAGNNITVQGSMHKDLNIKYDLCNKNSEEYKLLSSAKGNNKILSTYSVSLTDKDGNYIPAELWCSGSYKISVPVDSKNIQLAGIDTDGNIVFCKPDSVENGTAVFTVSYPMSFAIVETTAENPSSNNNNNGTPIQTGSEMCGAILLAALLSLTVILIAKRRNKIG